MHSTHTTRYGQRGETITTHHQPYSSSSLHNVYRPSIFFSRLFSTAIYVHRAMVEEMCGCAVYCICWHFATCSLIHKTFKDNSKVINHELSIFKKNIFIFLHESRRPIFPMTLMKNVMRCTV